jgi:hypothetical protein
MGQAEMREHEAAKIFPPMTGEEFAALVADMREHGQRQPIVLHDGAVLDGRHRWHACRTLGIEPKTVEWNGVGSPLAYVISINLHRRHLNESQRALIGARMATRRNGQSFGGKQKSGVLRTNAEEEPPSAKEAAAMVKVGEKTVEAARRVLRDGTPDEIKGNRGGRRPPAPVMPGGASSVTAIWQHRRFSAHSCHARSVTLIVTQQNGGG